MSDWSRIGSLMDFCASYYTTQLVRCAVFSFVLIGLVMLLRKVLFSERTFMRGLLWSSFLLLPFLGKLKLFYENKVVLNITWRLTAATMSWIWAFVVWICMGHSAVSFLGESVPDNFPETVLGGYGGDLRQGVYTKQRVAGT